MHDNYPAFSSPLSVSTIRKPIAEELFTTRKSTNTCRCTCEYKASSSQTSKSIQSIVTTLATCLAATLLPARPTKAGDYYTPHQEQVTSIYDESHQHSNLFNSAPSQQGYPKGTLLKVQPSQPTIPYSDNSTDNAGQHPSSSSRPGSSRLSQSTASFSGWASSGVSRGLRARRPSRFPIWRPATVGLVGVGALTSGSVVLRRLARKSNEEENNENENTAGVWSVICLHIPFCVSERALMLERMERLAMTANINTPEGMAKATREAAAVLLGEKGLLEDSRQFAPFLDVVVTDSLVQANRRFAAHVEIEGTRMNRAETEVCDQPSKDADYGILTMVVATTEGVNLHCYNEECTVMKRLRCALDGVAMLRAGQVCGLELIWAPRSMTGQPLNRKQLRCQYPFLQIA